MNQFLSHKNVLRDNAGVLKFVIHTAETLSRRGKKRYAAAKYGGGNGSGKYEMSGASSLSYFAGNDKPGLDVYVVRSCYCEVSE